METSVFWGLVERAGLAVAILSAGLLAFLRGDVIPRQIHERALADQRRDLERELDRLARDRDYEREYGERMANMALRAIQDARDGREIGREAIEVARRPTRAHRGGSNDAD